MLSLDSEWVSGHPTLSVEAAAALLGISRSTAYDLARRYRESEGADGLPCIKIGGRILIVVAGLREILGDLRPSLRADADQPGRGRMAAQGWRAASHRRSTTFRRPASARQSASRVRSDADARARRR